MDTVLIIALLTWGGVFCYLLRLDRLTRALERELKERGAARPIDR